MTTVADIAKAARVWLRDYPKFYSSETRGNGFGFSYRLSHPYVVLGDSEFPFVAAIVPDTGSPTTLVEGTDYTVDARNGFINLTSVLQPTQRLVVNFYASEWFLQSDLEMFAGFMVGEFGQDRTGYNVANIGQAEAEALGLGTVVMALWALLNELARDIDVSSYVDGTQIPASQRFRQVQAQLMMFEGMYKGKAAMLNVGLDRIEAFALRRVSLTTNRLVPIYLPREIDDLATPQRVYPVGDPMGPAEYATPNYPQAPLGATDPFLF